MEELAPRSEKLTGARYTGWIRGRYNLRTPCKKTADYGGISIVILPEPFVARCDIAPTLRCVGVSNPLS
jgi:hypothetical protein